MTTPPPPGGYSAGQAPLRAPRPQEVEISFWLWIATFVLGVVGAITMYSQIRAEAISRVLAQNPAVDQSTIESAATTGLVVGVVLAVLGGLGVLFGLLGLVVNPGAGSVTGLLQLLLLIGAIVAMFRPATNAWFRPQRL